jgi:hypothetical protein
MMPKGAGPAFRGSASRDPPHRQLVEAAADAFDPYSLAEHVLSVVNLEPPPTTIVAAEDQPVLFPQQQSRFVVDGAERH